MGKAREDRLAVLAAAVVHRLAEDAVHAGEPGEFGGLVDVVGAFVLLSTSCRATRSALASVMTLGDAEVELFVGALAVVDVVGHHAEGRG